MVLSEAMSSFLRPGCSMVVGGLTDDGEPFATRGWGLRLDDAGRVRVLVGTADLRRLGVASGASRAIAVTGGDVATLRSVQFKGTAEVIEEPTEEDRRQHRSFCDQFFDAVRRTDGTERALMQRLVPADLIVVVVRVEQVFDQPPGPRAGRPLPVA